jgi:hypothetical protein
MEVGRVKGAAPLFGPGYSNMGVADDSLAARTQSRSVAKITNGVRACLAPPRGNFATRDPRNREYRADVGFLHAVWDIHPRLG